MLGWCAGVSAKQFDVLLKVMKQQQQEQKPKLQPVQSQSELRANVSPQEVFASSELLCHYRLVSLLWGSLASDISVCISDLQTCWVFANCLQVSACGYFCADSSLITAMQA